MEWRGGGWDGCRSFPTGAASQMPPTMNGVVQQQRRQMAGYNAAGATGYGAGAALKQEYARTIPQPKYVHCSFGVKLHLRHKRTDRRRESNFVHFSLKMWHLVAIILMIFLIISWPNFLYLLVDPGFLSPPLKFLWSIAVRSSRRMDAPDRHNGQRYVSVRSFVRLLNGVWRKLIY